MCQFTGLCYRDTGGMTSPSCLGSAHCWQWKGTADVWEDQASSVTMTRKTILSTSPTGSGSAAWSVFQFATEHVSLVDRCLVMVLCNVHSDEERTRSKTRWQLYQAGNFKMVRSTNNTANASNVRSWTFRGLNYNPHIKSSYSEKHR